MTFFSWLKGRLRTEGVQAPASRPLRCGTPLLQHAKASGQTIQIEQDQEGNVIIHN